MRKALHIFGVLQDEDIDWIVRQGRRENIGPGEPLIREGVDISHLYILLDGRLEVRGGRDLSTLIAVLDPGEIVGEISFVDRRLPTASVVPVAGSQVLALSRSALTAKLASDQGFAARFYLAIASLLASRLFMTTSRFGYGRADQDSDPDMLDDIAMDQVSLANIRFDKLLRSFALSPVREHIEHVRL